MKVVLAFCISQQIVISHEIIPTKNPMYPFKTSSKKYDKTGVFFCVSPEKRKTPEVDKIINEYNSKIYNEYYNTEMAKFVGNIGMWSGAIICPLVTTGAWYFGSKCLGTNIGNHSRMFLGTVGFYSAFCAYLGYEGGKRIVGGTHYAANYIKNLVEDSVKKSFESVKEQFFGKSEKYASWYKGDSDMDFIKVTETRFNHPGYDESKYYPLTCSIATATIQSEKAHDNLYLRGEYSKTTIIRDPNDNESIKVDTTGNPEDSICTLVATVDLQYFHDVSTISRLYFYEFSGEPYDEFNRGSCSASYDFVKHAIRGDTKVIDASDINKGIGTKIRTNWNNKNTLDLIIKGKSSGVSHNNEDTKHYFDSVYKNIKQHSIFQDNIKALPNGS